MRPTYPYAPVKPREIPRMLDLAAFEHGMESFIEVGRTPKSEKVEILGEKTHQLKKRLEADVQQAEHGPLEAVTR